MRALQLQDWPGRDGHKLVLDQPLRLAFDHRLAPGLRTGALQLFELSASPTQALPRPVAAMPVEVSGSYLVLHPLLPKQPDLQDGSLRPGTRYRMILHGVPSLAAITGADGTVLVGDRALEFETLPADEPGVLGSATRSSELLPLLLPGGSGARRLCLIGSNGLLRIEVGVPLDPRCLQEPARLRAAGDAEGAGEGAPCALRLAENGARGAVLELALGSLEGAMVLELPPLEGLNGERLAEADRVLRVRPAPSE